jgi:hypothetical protein
MPGLTPARPPGDQEVAPPRHPARPMQCQFLRLTCCPVDERPAQRFAGRFSLIAAV